MAEVPRTLISRIRQETYSPCGREMVMKFLEHPDLAPKEHDLMFIGGGQGFVGYTAQEEGTLFYQGYGQVQIDPIALAYYRYERLVQDIAIYCEQIFLSNDGREDRERSLQYLRSNFLPDGTIAMAYRADPAI